MKYILFSLLVLFAIPVLASQTEITYDSPYIVATNSPVTLENALYEEFDPTPTSDGYCVSFVQKNGFSGFRGNANEWIKYIDPNIKEPQEGYAVVLSYGEIGHIGVFHAGELWHQNFEGRGIVSHGAIDQSRVIGYIPN